MKKGLREGLAALVLAAGVNCGDEISNNYYGPNGEEYEVNSGDCDEFKGKYLWALGNRCEFGTVEPIGQGCEVRMENPDRSLLWEGFMKGNRFTILNAYGFRKIDEGQYTLPIVYQFLKKGEFSRQDFSQRDDNDSIDRYMCIFDQGSDELRAGVVNGELYANENSRFRLTNQPYPGQRSCLNTEFHKNLDAICF